jgi:4-carboxymuconolactone decarboxylase
MNSEQRQLFGAVTSGKRARYNLDDKERIAKEGLRGPFNPWMYAPSIGMLAQGLGEALRFEGTLNDRQREIAILCVAFHWKADYEWWAHAKIAAGCGIEPSVIAAIHAGQTPQLSDVSELLVFEFSTSLLRENWVPDGLFRDTVKSLGDTAIVELVTLLGYYVMISMTLNAFKVELPAGESMPFGIR